MSNNRIAGRLSGGQRVRARVLSGSWPGRVGFGWLLLLNALSVPFAALAQLGVWRTHPAYRSAQTVVAVQNRVYCASQNGFFAYDPAANETTRLTRDDGFTDVGVSRLFYLADRKQLLIGYRSGTIDLLSVTDEGEPSGIRSITLIRDATQIGGSKRINQITRIGNAAYLACDFGIVVLNTTGADIQDTYLNIGPAGSSVVVYSTAYANDSLYAVTSRGLLAARFAPTVNLAYYGNWRPVTLPPGASIRSVVGANNQLFVAIPGAGVWQRQNGTWQGQQALPAINNLLLNASEWVGVTPGGLQRQNGTLIQDTLIGRPKEITELAGSLWVADSLNGLLRIAGNTVQSASPDGPASDLFQRLYAATGQLIALPGGFDANLRPLGRRRGFDRFGNDQWQSVGLSSLPTDFVAAAYNPADQRLYAASFGGGLWALSSQNNIEKISQVPASISSLAVDGAGNLWMAAPNTLSTPALYVRRPDGSQASFTPSRGTIVQLVPDDNGFLWMRLNPTSGGLLVFDPAGNRSRLLSTQTGSGSLPSNSVRSLVRDRDGLIWVGTDQGVAVFDDPSTVFTSNVNAYTPIFEGRRLLSNESVTALAVDGGDRKWMGTQNGLYLFNADGTAVINQFTTENSLLPSNAITDIAIEPVSGEVLVATPNGLASYRGSATEPAAALTGITIFPNPVRPDFGGSVAINGLVENTVVKIMDAAGQLVYETRSQGGTATWNLQTYRGQRAETGIYFVFAIAPDGQQGLAGKLAVVR